jgi:hypothetical protein
MVLRLYGFTGQPIRQGFHAQLMEKLLAGRFPTAMHPISDRGPNSALLGYLTVLAESQER